MDFKSSILVEEDLSHYGSCWSRAAFAILLYWSLLNSSRGYLIFYKVDYNLL